MLSQAYNFMIETIFRDAHILLVKIKDVRCFSSYIMYSAFTFQWTSNNNNRVHKGIVLKCIGYSPEPNGSISLLTFDEQLLGLQSHVLALSTQLMVCFSTV